MLFKENISERKWILLTIETKAREFYSKLLFACFAVNKGWGVIIGPRNVIRREQSSLPKGILIEKSISNVDLNHIKNSISNGNKVFAWDEEGLIYLNEKDYLERRVSKEVLELIDMLFCWGEKQANIFYTHLSDYKDKVYIAGNPRIDLLRPEFRNIFENKKIKKKYGDFILVNTKFGIILPNDSYKDKHSSYIEYLKNTGRCSTKETENLLNEFIDYNRKTLNHYNELIPVLSNRFPNNQIIIRPHPSEDNIYWINKFRNLKNVKVIYEGNSNDWIYSSRIMIHSNCTTGVESYLLGKKSISYIPIEKTKLEAELPTLLSYKAACVDEVCTLVKVALNCKLKNNEEFKDEQVTEKYDEQVTEKYIEGTKGEFSSNLILNLIGKHHQDIIEEALLINNVTKNYYKVKYNLSKYKRKFNKRFPEISYSEVNILLNKLRNSNNIFKDVNFKEIKPNTFCFYK